ncbi:hypothetical protein ACLMAL_34570 [Nocardia sp. CWNU-33]|uniref:hypothetical protein n=1 Tax=Nocardia sp. CWNU-33 TaxID=3392117 RepID=UPI00398EB165
MRILLLPIEPTQLPRLDEVQADITKRIDTVRTQQWLGDIDQLPTTLIHIEAKRDGLLELRTNPTQPWSSLYRTPEN